MTDDLRTLAEKAKDGTGPKAGKAMADEPMGYALIEHAQRQAQIVSNVLDSLAKGWRLWACPDPAAHDEAEARAVPLDVPTLARALGNVTLNEYADALADTTALFDLAAAILDASERPAAQERWLGALEGDSTDLPEPQGAEYARRLRERQP